MDGLPRHSRTADFNTRVTRVTAWGAFAKKQLWSQVPSLPIEFNGTNDHSLLTILLGNAKVSLKGVHGPLDSLGRAATLVLPCPLIRNAFFFFNLVYKVDKLIYPFLALYRTAYNTVYVLGIDGRLVIITPYLIIGRNVNDLWEIKLGLKDCRLAYCCLTTHPLFSLWNVFLKKKKTFSIIVKTKSLFHPC